MQRLENLEQENKALRSMITRLEARVAALEVGGGSSGAPATKSAPPQVDYCPNTIDYKLVLNVLIMLNS